MWKYVRGIWILGWMRHARAYGVIQELPQWGMRFFIRRGPGGV